MTNKKRLNTMALEMMKMYSGDPKRIQHFTKVHAYSKLIGEMENLDEKTLFILEAAAYTHDIGIKICEEKYNGKCGGKLQEKEGPDAARKLLSSLNFDSETVERVCYLIAHHHTYSNIEGSDYQILVEADFLVNLYEDTVSKDEIRTAMHAIFRTKTGKQLCSTMYKL